MSLPLTEVSRIGEEEDENRRPSCILKDVDKTTRATAERMKRRHSRM